MPRKQYGVNSKLIVKLRTKLNNKIDRLAELSGEADGVRMEDLVKTATVDEQLKYILKLKNSITLLTKSIDRVKNKQS